MSDQLEKYEFHPAANIMPLLEGKDFEDLVESIKTNGQREPIDLLDGKIIDGRNRYRACIEAGVEPDFYDEKETKIEDPIQYVLDKNLHRRHLTTSQRAMIAADVKEWYAAQAKERKKATLKKGSKKPDVEKLPQRKEQGKARDKAGKALHVSGKSVDHAEKVKKSGNKKLINDVKAGKITVSKAAKKIAGKKSPSISETTIKGLIQVTAIPWGIKEQWGSIENMFHSDAWQKEENILRIGEYIDAVARGHRAFTQLHEECREYAKNHGIEIAEAEDAEQGSAALLEDKVK